MPIEVDCPKCSKSYRVGDDKAGRRFRCKQCEAVITVPEPAAAAAGDDEWDFGGAGGDDEFAMLPGAAPAVSAGQTAGKKKSSGKRKGKRKKKKGTALPVGLIAGIAGGVLLLGGLVAGGIWLWNNLGNQRTAYIPANAAGAVIIDVARLQESPLIAGIDLADTPLGEEDFADVADRLESVVIFGTGTAAADRIGGGIPGIGGLGGFGGGGGSVEDEGGVVLRFKESEGLDKLIKDKIEDESEEFEFEGYPAYRNKSEDMIAVRPEDTVLLMASEDLMAEMLKADSGGAGPLADTISDLPGSYDIAVAFNMAALEDKRQDQIDKLKSSGAAEDSPQMLLLSKTEDGHLVFDLSADEGDPLIALNLNGEFSDDEAQKLLDQMQKGVDAAKGFLAIVPDTEDEMGAAVKDLRTALGSYEHEGSGGNISATISSPGLNNWAKFFKKMSDDGPSFPGGGGPAFPGGGGGPSFPDDDSDFDSGFDDSDFDSEPMSNSGSGGGFGNPFTKARDAAELAEAKNNLKQVIIGIHNHHDVYNQLPFGAIPGAENKPTQSPLVHLLPFVEQTALYEKVDFDQSDWSAQPVSVTRTTPDVYRMDDSIPQGHTDLRYFVGPGEFGGPGTVAAIDGPRFRDITDGLSNTILFVQVGKDKTIPWGKAEGLTFHPNDPAATKRELGNLPETFVVGFMDGFVRSFNRDIDPETLQKLLTHNGAERVQIP